MKLAVLLKYVEVLGLLLLKLTYADSNDKCINQNESLAILPIIQSLASTLQQSTASIESSGTVLVSVLQKLEETNKMLREIQNSMLENEWGYFVTSTEYSDTRLVTELPNNFTQEYFPKTLSRKRATNKCKRSCGQHRSCLAFNLYEVDGSFVCEMLADSLWFKKSRLAFAKWPGGTVWEKVRPGYYPFVDREYSLGKKIPCNFFQPGATGEWPDCQTTYHCPYSRYSYNIETSYSREKASTCTFWPSGSLDFKLPIFAHCNEFGILLYRRVYDKGERRDGENYVLPFEDMHRLSVEGHCKKLLVLLGDLHSEHHVAVYEGWAVSPNGTLSVEKYELGPDVFDLKSATETPAKFPWISVEEDSKNCGSFWLLDPYSENNCPDGIVKMFLEYMIDSGNLVNVAHVPVARIDKDITSIEIVVSK